MPTKKFYSKKFCPKCGNLITDKSTFCKDCTVYDFDFKDIILSLCNNCSSYNYRNKWTKFKSLNLVIKRIVNENIKSKVVVKNLTKDKIEELLSYKAGIKKDFSVEVHKKHQVFELPAKIEVTLCTKCSKQGTKYFESILQVRNLTPEILQFLRSDVEKQRKRGIYITKEVPLDKYSEANIDFSITNNNYAKILAEKIRKNFGGIIKQNSQLYSIDWETSKNQYRLHVYVEIPKYIKGEVLKINEHLYYIVSISSKIHVIDLKNNRKTSIPYKNNYDVLKPTLFMIIKKYPEFEVLDPNTYYQAHLMNPDEKLEINQKIKVIIDGGEAWMV